ncbi:SRP54-type protein [Tritrichomonas foetus]|uniref:signal-recognition-particle GTPase n=1 Tax=Tritrichomonas foetus TaxID=1144522 RepID=A0A1J4JVT1_9EUKA|nr:SRP54-type protein [Tritrichomonas foetus]|eukprot:OHT01389.1 SRP54-type protein [Tritrichomonas foetus]
MVLQDLGEKILNGLNKLANAKNIDDAFFKEFMAEMINALKSADVNQMTIINFMKEVKSKVNLADLPPGVSARKIIEREVLNALVKMIDPGTQPWEPEKDKVNVIMMVGLQGAGKTTTCTKLGNYYKKRGWKVGVIAADTFRAGAREQLMQNAQQVNIPYYVDFVTEDPVEVALSGVEKFKREKFNMVIVDTSGRHMQEAALFAEMQQLEDAINPDQVIFVLDGTIGQMAFNQAKAFSEAVGVGSIIVTKLDSDAKGGGALSAVAATNSPILFYGTGEGMSSLEVFDAKSFVSRMLGFGDVMAFARKMEEIDMDKQKQVAQRILEGHFTFREMYTQYQTVLEMGDLSSLMDTMGMKQFIPKEMSNESMTDNVKKMLVVIDSMSDEEVENPPLFRDESRRRRLARGTGLPPMFINYVIDEQKRFAKMFSKMSGPMIKKLIQMDQDPSSMNPRAMQQAMSGLTKAMDPRMLQQVGGLGGLQRLMNSSLAAAKNKK